MEEVLKTSTRVTHILKHKREPCLLLLTEDFILFQLKIHQDGSVTQLLKARLDVRTVTSSIKEDVIFHDIIWTSDGILCAATGTSNVLCWDLEKNESVHFQIPTDLMDQNQCTISLNYLEKSSELMIGTTGGNYIIGTFENPSITKKRQWHMTSMYSLESSDEILFFVQDPEIEHTFAVTKSELFSIEREDLKTLFNDGMAAIQTNQTEVAIYSCNQQKAMAVIDSGLIIKGLAIDRKHLTIWSNTAIQVYEQEQNEWSLLSDFPLTCTVVAMSNESLYIAQSSILIVTNLIGIQKVAVRFPKDEGKPLHLCVSMNLLVIVTDRFAIKLMDINGTEPIPLREPVYCSEKGPHNLLSLRCNADGSTISLLMQLKAASLYEDTTTNELYLLNTEKGEIKKFNLSDHDDNLMDHHWDPSDPRLLCISSLISNKVRLAICDLSRRYKK